MATSRTTATNVKTLTKALYEDFNALRMGTIQVKIAKESANIAGKILKAYQVRLENKKLSGHKENIEGIES